MVSGKSGVHFNFRDHNETFSFYFMFLHERKQIIDFSRSNTKKLSQFVQEFWRMELSLLVVVVVVVAVDPADEDSFILVVLIGGGVVWQKNHIWIIFEGINTLVTPSETWCSNDSMWHQNFTWIFEPAEKETNKKCLWKEEIERKGGVWSNLCNNAQREKQQNNCYTLLLTNIWGGKGRERDLKSLQQRK